MREWTMSESTVHTPMEDLRDADPDPIGYMRKERADVLQRRIVEYRERIKELESQVPNVVVPVWNDGKSVARCKCVYGDFRKNPVVGTRYLTVQDHQFPYCPQCGAKLNWEEEK